MHQAVPFITALLAMWVPAHGATLTTLASFAGDRGARTTGSLIVDNNGNLFGMVNGGGGASYGMVFELAKGSNAITRPRASFASGQDGISSTAGLIADPGGNLYGTADAGGSAGCGMVFQLANGSGTAKPLASFDCGSLGSYPNAGLVADADDHLYGTTTFGGSANHGTVFMLTKGSSTVTSLASFAGGVGGAVPSPGLIADAQGNLFGTTIDGGSANHGTVFTLNKGSSTITTLAGLPGGNGVSVPAGGLIADDQGNLFGMTEKGGAADEGTVFMLARGAHSITILASFPGSNDGARPSGSMIVDARGNLFGVTRNGGSAENGTVFMLAKGSNTVTVLARFTGGSDGGRPCAGLVADRDGNLFGTTTEFGSSRRGTVFVVTDSGFVVPESKPRPNRGR